MKRFSTAVRTVALRLCAAASLAHAQAALAQDGSQPTPESKFVDIGDVRLHYLDFGGRGLPILFIHAGERGASTWEGFAPRFTDHHRVLAITARGVGESEGEISDPATRAGDILGNLEAL